MGIENVENLTNDEATPNTSGNATQDTSGNATQDTSAAAPVDVTPTAAQTPTGPTTSPDVVIIDNVPDPEADATQDDSKAEQTDNAPTEVDGSQDGIDQNAVKENEIVVDDANG